MTSSNQTTFQQPALTRRERDTLVSRLQQGFSRRHERRSGDVETDRGFEDPSYRPYFEELVQEFCPGFTPEEILDGAFSDGSPVGPDVIIGEHDYVELIRRRKRDAANIAQCDITAAEREIEYSGRLAWIGLITLYTGAENESALLYYAYALSVDFQTLNPEKFHAIEREAVLQAKHYPRYVEHLREHLNEIEYKTLIRELREATDRLAAEDAMAYAIREAARGNLIEPPIVAEHAEEPQRAVAG